MTQNEVAEAAEGQHGAGRPKWLVMIYLAGDNNLSANSIAVMQELEAALPPSDEVRVLACFDSNTPRPRGARYVEINHRRRFAAAGPGGPQWDLHNDLVPFEDLPGHAVVKPDFCNTGPSPARAVDEPAAKEGLSRFLKFALDNHEADRHMLIVYGHGTAVGGRTFLADDNPPSFVRLKDFAEILSRHFDARDGAGKPALDILACDNCVMNGVELAFQIRNQVKYLLGSQGLMLAIGWPYRKIIEEVVAQQDADAREVAVAILRKCARNLMDFSLMDRSSEQAVCDLTRLREEENLVTAVKELSAAMRAGLDFDGCGMLRFPVVRDAIRLARLEAQSYWDETFVDLYDFCLLLLEQCNQAVSRLITLAFNLNLNNTLTLNLTTDADPPGDAPHAEGLTEEASLRDFLTRNDPALERLAAIAARCQAVLREIKAKRFVARSYYIGPELQYSNGVSIYFPWCLPETPVIFEPYGRGGRVAGGGYGITWSGLEQLGSAPEDFVFKTAFDEYSDYEFAKEAGGDWAAFLNRFFRATLRDVRRFEVNYVEGVGPKFFDSMREEEMFISPDAVNLQKSGSDKAGEDFDPVSIKNYPRRFYVSPADCLRRCDLPRNEECNTEEDREYCASYLGWNVRGLMAEVIGLGQRAILPAPQGADGTAGGGGQTPPASPAEDTPKETD